MADIDDIETFDDQVASGASLTYPLQCSALRKNGVVCIKNKPCKIVEMSTSKTGKHGHAKVHLVGIDLFTGKKLEDICPSTHNMDVPNIKRVEYECIGADEDYLILLDENYEERKDVKVPDNDAGKEIRERLKTGETFIVTVLKAMDQESPIATKNLQVKST